jgi:hypothetical protein
MFLNRKITKSTGSYSDNINRLKEEIRTSDAIIIGAGAGLSTSAGFIYAGKRFEEFFTICIQADSIHIKQLKRAGHSGQEWCM